MNAPVIVVGAGGHGRVVADTLRAAGMEIIGFTDSGRTLHTKRIDGHLVLGTDDVLADYDKSRITLANGIGSTGIPDLRRDVQLRLESAGWRFETIIHPRATVSPGARLTGSVQVMAGAVIQTGAAIGAGSIVNTGAVVDHDCVIGTYCHIAPGATLSGEVQLGDECHVGTGAAVIQGVRLGPRTLIGAGAVVVGNHPGASILAGVPARERTS